MRLPRHPDWDLPPDARLAKARDVALHHFLVPEVDCAFAALVLIGQGGEAGWTQAFEVIRFMGFTLVHRPVGRLLLLSQWKVAIEAFAPDGEAASTLHLAKLREPEAWTALGWAELTGRCV